MRMSSVSASSFRLWIVINLVSLVSSQRFVIYDSLRISTKASGVTEIESNSVLECARACKRNNLCHRTSYDAMTKLCQIFNDETSRNCDVEMDVSQTSMFLKKVDGKLFNIHIFSFLVGTNGC